MAKARFPGKPSKFNPNSRLRVSVKCLDLQSDVAKDISQQIATGFQYFQSTFEPKNDVDEVFHGFGSDGQSTVGQSLGHEESHVERDKQSNDAVCFETVEQASEPDDSHITLSTLPAEDSPKNDRKSRKTGEKSPRKFVLPSRSAHSSRPIIPNKRFLEESSPVEPRKVHVTESREPQKEPVEEETKLEKDRIKKEIERYTDIITTEHKADKRRRLKEEKMREKIQQLLRSQWESRLSGDSNQKGETPAGRGSSMSISSEDDSPSCSSNRVILRKPRLKLNQQLLKQLRQPKRLQQFGEQIQVSRDEPVLRPPQLVIDADKNLLTSDNLMEKLGMNPVGCAFVTDQGDVKKLPGTVVCGVCGAVRQYSFVLQVRKFGTFSCEPCRKFISRVLRNRLQVECLKKFGQCMRPPLLQGSLSPSSSGAGNEGTAPRCEACWLKLALNGFRMKEADHDELRKLLPLDMQVSVPPSSERSSGLASAPNRGQIIQLSKSFQPSLLADQPAENQAAAQHRVVPAREAKIAVYKEKTPGGWSKKYSPKLGAQENVREPTIEHCAGSRTPGINSTRTELETKGPRVKNVCRSAMIALGQPKALFEDKQQQNTSQELPICTDPVCVGCTHTKPDNACLISPSASSAANNLQLLGVKNVLTTTKNSDSSLDRPAKISEGERRRITCRARSTSIEQVESPAVRAFQPQVETSSPLRLEPTINTKKMRKLPPARNSLLSLGFCEPFSDPGIWSEGFAVMGSALGVSQLCYLCGSGGKDELICCSGCCEPFHPYCVSNAGSEALEIVEKRRESSRCNHWERDVVKGKVTREESFEEPEEDLNTFALEQDAQKSWFCRKCQPCRVCCNSTGDRIHCSCCSHAYHGSCLPAAYPLPDRNSAWICLSCAQCSNCRRKGVSKTVGKLLFCSGCHKEELLKHFCPVCFKGSTNKDQWLLDCSCCGQWVHKECEGLGQEEFFLLSFCKEDFTCRACREEGNSHGPELKKYLNSRASDLLSSLSQDRKWQVHVGSGSKDDLDRIKVNISLNWYTKSLELYEDLERLGTDSSLGLDFLKQGFRQFFPWLVTGEKPEPKLRPTTSSRDKETLEVRIPYDWESDFRSCLFCRGKGEGDPGEEGRLLHCGNNEWIHVNCALWSNEIYEKHDGGLQNVFAALNRSRMTRCGLCSYKGASLSCCFKSCSATYHFPCARKDETILLLEDKNIFCADHRPPAAGKPKQNRFEVERKVYVDLRSELKRIKTLPPNCVQLVIGSLKIKSIGELKTEIPASKSALFPANYRCERVFWSVKEPWKRTVYTICAKYVPGRNDVEDQDVHVTVSHEDEDVIMAESGLNIPEMETQEDSELIHMVLEDADFEQELVRGTSSARSPPSEVRDSGFYSDVQSETSPCPVEQESTQSLEAWLADPEHAVILLDSALLASLDIDANSLPSGSSNEVPTPPCNAAAAVVDAEESEQSEEQISSSSKRLKSNRRVSYSQWKKLKLENQRLKNSRTATVDWNGNEAEWSSGASSLVASIKVSPLVEDKRLETLSPVTRDRSSVNILQLDGAADSSDAESEVLTTPLNQATSSAEPVKCCRCKRFYRTLQSFNKHSETCYEILSSSTSDEEAEEVVLVPKKEVLENSPIQVPIVNSSSQISTRSPNQVKNSLSPSSKPPRTLKTRRKPKRSPDTTRRPLAARLPVMNTGFPMIASQPQPQLRTIHITIPQPLPPPPPPQHVVYLSSNLNPPDLTQFAVPQPQQHVLIIPRMEPGMLQTQQLQTQPTIYGAPPMMQYYGSYPPELLTFGPVNMGMPNLSGLLPGMTPVQCHIPWETAPAVSPVVVLPPQQQLQPYPVISTVIPVEQPSFVQVPEPLPDDGEPCDAKDPEEHPEPAEDPPEEKYELQTEISEVVPEQCEAVTADLEEMLPVPETTGTFETLEEMGPCDNSEFDEEFQDPGQPPRPTYSYRMAMNSEKKNPLTAALIAAAITTADLDPGEEPSPPFATQQLKVTAETSESQRTFRIKASVPSEKPRGPHIVYELTSEDGFKASSASIADLWQQLLNAVQDARLAYKLEPLPDAVFVGDESDSLKVLGLNHPALRYLLEQLPNSSSCSNYQFLYHQPEPQTPLVGSPFGFARAAPYSGRNPLDIFNWLASEHRQKPPLDCLHGTDSSTSRRATNFDLLPLSARFRNLRQTSRYSVGVFRSGIHGRGLFCKRDFEAGEMVVEYAGEIIRSIVSDKREKEYEARGIGCYMFRIDDHTVVDATMHGNAARFINHSCEPNCYSRIVDVQGKKQIVIFALRRIQRGEELTYDYKFPIEEVKIPCTCATRRCRKYLN